VKTSHASMTFAGFLLLVAACSGAANEPGVAPQPGQPAGSGTAAQSNTSSQATMGKPGADGPAVEVLLCDGKTKATFAESTPGTQIASALMNEWLRKNPDANWEANERERHTLVGAADNKALIGQGQGQTYGRITEQDVLMWKTETERLAAAGSRVFHNGDELGSTIAVSCDMCHPHAANTHPETYPKFQQQLGRVVLLRDMINWCLEHPVRAKPMSADDPRMRAMEAYIYAQRRGKTLDYGKH
jgi:thiosulfate dehydrogenase